MKKITGGILVIALVLVALIAIAVSGYNRLVSAQTGVEAERSNIQTQLQRRADLIPNLVQTVSNYTAHETEVFTAVTEAREALLAARTVPEMAEADSRMSTALNGLIAIAEAYPELTSNTVYVGLMDELSGTENRIAVARTDYNDAVRSYNLAIRRFPGALIARLFGFTQAAYFEAGEAAQAVPAVPAIS